MYQATDEVLKNIIRHELAHYLTFLFHGPDIGHGIEFQEICRRLHWEKSISKASMSNEELRISNEMTMEVDHLIEKVKKLLALADSDNEHESQIATSKANKLILEYNLDRITSKIETEEEIYLLRALEAKNKSAKLSAIVDILKSFFVSPIFNLGKGHVYLELIGEKKNVLIAEYVAHFLDQELDRLFKKAQKVHPHLKGKVAKNSFMRGVAIGYNQKIQEIHRATASSNQLLIIKNDLEKNLGTVYPNLSSIRINLKENKDAMNLGKQEGLNLNIKKSLKSENKSIFLLQ